MNKQASNQLLDVPKIKIEMLPSSFLPSLMLPLLLLLMSLKDLFPFHNNNNLHVAGCSLLLAGFARLTTKCKRDFYVIIDWSEIKVAAAESVGSKTIPTTC